MTGLPFPEISPFVFPDPVFGVQIPLRWYALAYIIGIVLGWRLSVAALRRPHLWAGGVAPMTPPQLEALLTWIILGIIAGGRLGYVLFYQPGYFLQNPLEIPAIWQGGMSFHGGFLGAWPMRSPWPRRRRSSWAASPTSSMPSFGAGPRRCLGA
jgi:phosphatidylglycerol:prolipoprotein diacylglycerol transferase